MILLTDRRRRRNGNRTVKMPLKSWQKLLANGHGYKAREICRVPMPLDWLAKNYHGSKPELLTLVYNLIHYCESSSPADSRKKYASTIRAMLSESRKRRLHPIVKNSLPGDVQKFILESI